MTDEEQTRDEIEEIVSDEPIESVQETIIEEEVTPVVKAKPKAKQNRKSK